MKSAYALAIIWYLKNKFEQLYQENIDEKMLTTPRQEIHIRGNPFMIVYPFLCMKVCIWCIGGIICSIPLFLLRQSYLCWGLSFVV